MSPDELMVLVGAGAFGLVWWVVWAVRLIPLAGAPSRRRGLVGLMASLAASVAIVGTVLLTASASDVRTAPQYLVMYGLLGLAWLRLGEFFLAFAGVSARDDVIERGNQAAIPAVGGALVAVACCYAGGNIGEGPGWWVVVFSAALATVALGLVWIFLDFMTDAFETVTVDRDLAAGVRLGGFLIACGLIFGRAVAGNWVSVGNTIIDFIQVAWFAVPLVIAAVAIERLSRPTPSRPQLPVVAFGLLPAAVFIGAAAAYLILLGLPA